MTAQSTVKIMIHDATTTGDENDRYDTFLSCFFPCQVTFRGILQFGTCHLTPLNQIYISFIDGRQNQLKELYYQLIYQTEEFLDRRYCNIG